MKSITFYICLMGLAIFNTACDELEEINARKRTGQTSTSVTYTGTITTASDPLSVCDDGTTTSVVLDLETLANFDITFTGNANLDDLNAALIYEVVAYTNPTSFNGFMVANDPNGDFEDPFAAGCNSQGGYANVIEVNLVGNTSSNDATITNATFTASARCNDTDSKSQFCSGTFSGQAVTN